MVTFSTSASAQETYDVLVTITKGEAVQISGVDDQLIGIFDADAVLGAATVRATIDDICVYSTTGLYDMTLESIHPGRVMLRGSSGVNMNYLIDIWTRDAAGSGALQRIRRSRATEFTNRLASRVLGCTDGSVTMRLRTFVTRARFNEAPPGIYQDTLILTVRPG